MITASKHLNVLLIEDSEDDALLTVAQLKRSGYEVIFKRVETAEALKAALDSENWNIVLSDFQMPHFNGFEALEILKKTGKDIPFIIISGAIGEETAVKLMKKGANDYIMKDNLQRLFPAIEREIRESNNRAKQRSLEHIEKLLVQERLSHYWFFESMDKINRAIQGKNNLSQMMSEVLEVVLSIFDSDRAYLLFPCDPNASTWQVPMERYKPGYGQILELGKEMTMDENVAQLFRILLNTPNPVMFGPGTNFPIPEDISKKQKFKSFMAMVIYPKIGKPWQFGIHQCNKAKIWNKEEERLFHEIGRRITDGLSSLLMYREKSIQEAENRLLINAVPDLLFRVHKSGKIIDFRKPEHMDLYFPSKQLLNKPISKVLPKHVFDSADIAIKKALKTNKIITFEYELTWKNKLNYLEGRAIKLTQGEVLIVIRDITEQKLTNLEIKKLSLAVEQSPVSIVITDTKGKITYVNKKFTILTGYSKKETLGQNPRILKSGKIKQETYTQLWQNISTGKEWFGELCNKKKNGELYWEQASISPIFNDSGKATHYLAIKEDITHRKISENALLESERKYRIVADNTYNWEFWSDIDDKFIYCSPSCLRVTGYCAEEFLNNSKLSNEIVHPDYKIQLKKKQSLLQKNKVNISFQYKIIHKNGSIRWIEQISRSVFDPSGTYIGHRGSIRDITEQKESDRKVLDAIISTEENERNRFSQELHDGLGPMLSTVKLYFQWLGETTNNKKRQNIIDVGLQNIDDAVQTVREISNNLSPRVLTNLGLLPAMKYLIHRINITQKIKIDILTDIEIRYNSHLEVTLYRILSELINNTIKHALAQNISIKFKHDKAKNKIHVTYEDDGKGFDLKEIQQNTKGIGLQNMIQRVETLDGIISFNTNKNKPLSVKIQLPLTEASV